MEYRIPKREGQEQADPVFDLMIGDVAHRVTGSRVLPGGDLEVTLTDHESDCDPVIGEIPDARLESGRRFSYTDLHRHEDGSLWVFR